MVCFKSQYTKLELQVHPFTLTNYLIHRNLLKYTRKVFPMRKKKRIAVCCVAALLLLLCVVWFLFPHSLQRQFTGTEPFSISTVVSGVTTDGKAASENHTYTLQPDTTAYQELAALWNDYSFHNNCRSLFPSDDLALHRQNITILISDGERCITLTDGGELAIQKSADSGSRRYTVGYFGNSKSQQLCETILSILEKEET